MTGLRTTLLLHAPAGRWTACFALLGLSVVLCLLPVAGDLPRAGLSAAALVLAGLAVGVPRRRALAGMAVAGAALGLMLPGGWAQAAIAAAVLLLLAALAVIWSHRPFSRQRIVPGLRYRAGGAEHRVPELRFRGAPPFLLRQQVLDGLVDLAAYTDALLTRHHIRYAADCGTLLGVVRHGGVIPWDDDVDFILYEGVDRRRMEDRFAAMAAEAERDGYRLFRHGSYWKIARPGFWRYPVVDIYHPGWSHAESVPLQRVPWEGVSICAPADAADRVVRRYGPDALEEVVHDIPFWDSGFVPSFVTRLGGYRAISAASELFARLFAVTSK